MRHDDTPSPAPIPASQASAANGEALPGWPAVPVAPTTTGTPDIFMAPGRDYLYMVALASAWEARARLAVEALRDISSQGIAMQSRCTARETLAAIGDLPPSPKEQRT